MDSLAEKEAALDGDKANLQKKLLELEQSKKDIAAIRAKTEAKALLLAQRAEEVSPCEPMFVDSKSLDLEPAAEPSSSSSDESVKNIDRASDSDSPMKFTVDRKMTPEKTAREAAKLARDKAAADAADAENKFKAAEAALFACATYGEAAAAAMPLCDDILVSVLS